MDIKEQIENFNKNEIEKFLTSVIQFIKEKYLY